MHCDKAYKINSGLWGALCPPFFHIVILPNSDFIFTASIYIAILHLVFAYCVLCTIRRENVCWANPQRRGPLPHKNNGIVLWLLEIAYNVLPLPFSRSQSVHRLFQPVFAPHAANHSQPIQNTKILIHFGRWLKGPGWFSHRAQWLPAWFLCFLYSDIFSELPVWRVSHSRLGSIPCRFFAILLDGVC